MKTVLVTGGNGQLGLCLKDILSESTDIQFVFTGFQELDITNRIAIQAYFSNNRIDYCINCAAHTAVDLAESEADKAKFINVEGPKNLALACKDHNATLIHISTDFVFDGAKQEPYLENDKTNPLSVYGQTKLEGENQIQQVLKNHFIIRTSWLYSEYGNNFMKTMIRLGGEKEFLNVVNDQFGSPTYARDLAKVILGFIKRDSNMYGTYHYSNEGKTSWYDFAKEIFDLENSQVQLNGIPTSAYPTPAERPKQSVLNKSKIKEMFNIDIPLWKDSLKMALANLKKKE